MWAAIRCPIRLLTSLRHWWKAARVPTASSSRSTFRPNAPPSTKRRQVETSPQLPARPNRAACSAPSRKTYGGEAEGGHSHLRADLHRHVQSRISFVQRQLLGGLRSFPQQSRSLRLLQNCRAVVRAGGIAAVLELPPRRLRHFSSYRLSSQERRIDALCR